jgi:valyl-tRNA synthetase
MFPRSNIMDRWILASCHSLIKFVREEMAGIALCSVQSYLASLTRSSRAVCSVSFVHRRATIAEIHSELVELVSASESLALEGNATQTSTQRSLEHFTNIDSKIESMPLTQGDADDDDCLVALSALFEVLYKSVLTMSPFTPFICEAMYQVGIVSFARNIEFALTFQFCFVELAIVAAGFRASSQRPFRRCKTIFFRVFVLVRLFALS